MCHNTVGLLQHYKATQVKINEILGVKNSTCNVYEYSTCSSVSCILS